MFKLFKKSKPTPTKESEVIDAYQKGRSIQELAEQYGVTTQNIIKVVEQGDTLDDTTTEEENR